MVEPYAFLHKIKIKKSRTVYWSSWGVWLLCSLSVNAAEVPWPLCWERGDLLSLETKRGKKLNQRQLNQFG